MTSFLFLVNFGSRENVLYIPDSLGTISIYFCFIFQSLCIFMSICGFIFSTQQNNLYSVHPYFNVLDPENNMMGVLILNSNAQGKCDICGFL